jgi:hypothetical protein
MSAPGHEHVWVSSGDHDLRCACGASHAAIQTVLGAAADEARSVAGDHYTGCRVRQASETVELWLFRAPAQVLEKLEASNPGVYVIHNDAPRPASALDELRDSFDWVARKAEGIEAVAVGPSVDGYLQVGVLDDVEGAQRKLDAIYGPDVVRVYETSQAIALPATVPVRR